MKKTAPPSIRLKLNERTAYRFLHLAGQIMRCLAEMYSPRYGLTIAKWKVLSVIGACGPLSATELGRCTSLEPDKVTRTVDDLVKRNLVLRRQDPADRRRVILTLSPKGKGVNDSIEQVRRAIEVEFVGVLNDDELKVLYAILDKLDERAAEIFTGKDAWLQIMARSEPANTMRGLGKQAAARKRSSARQRSAKRQAA